MTAYDVTCPCCGHRNKDLYLEETEGWMGVARAPRPQAPRAPRTEMECEKCGELTKVSNRFKKRVKIPVFRMEDLGKVMAAGLI